MSGGADAEIEIAETDAASLQVIDEIKNVGRGSTEASDFRDKQRVTECEAPDQGIQTRTLSNA